MDDSERGDLRENARYWKRWHVTVTARVQLASLRGAAHRRALLEWFSDGLFGMFGETRNFIVPGPMMVPTGPGNLRYRQMVPFRLTPANREPTAARVRYQVEIGPVRGFVHAHVYVEIEMRRSHNFRLRMFNHLLGDPWWWEQHWQPTFLARRTDGTQREITSRSFGWHVTAVRPRDPDRDDVLEYIAKTVSTEAPYNYAYITDNPYADRPERDDYDGPVEGYEEIEILNE
jgi:hypothetical protein